MAGIASIVNVQIYIPVISMLLISIAATILLFRLAERVSPVTVGVPCADAIIHRAFGDDDAAPVQAAPDPNTSTSHTA
ncbi:hypothetical protein [Mycobacterium sp.]|uniref:hypothetical protein n=1 Tax=Mycobacterium sp. TaxID=1785 RepID=UPI002D06F8B1|nr:hypothetical protein [Mycobacterium sp.]HTY35085.1 hypothetical protein [Mycobacterium sp.]